MSLASLLFRNSAETPARAPIKVDARRRTVAPSALRREVVNVALRDTLIRHNIPAAWLGLELQPVRSSRGEAQCYVRLQLRHWEPRLLPLIVAFQTSLGRRVVLLDASAATWLRGVLWQFMLPDDSACPPMPPASVWASIGPSQANAVSAASALPVLSARAALDRLVTDNLLPGGISDFQNTMPFDDIERRT